VREGTVGECDKLFIVISDQVSVASCKDGAREGSGVKVEWEENARLELELMGEGLIIPVVSCLA
jgi:hypothetical protein